MQTLIKPTIQVIENHAVTSSLDVSRIFSKDHNMVLRSIRALIGADEIDNEFKACNFAHTEYIDKNGEGRTAYNLTFDGFILLVMGYTGKRALQFKLAYIKAFNEMNRLLSKRPNAIGYETINVEQQYLISKAVKVKSYNTGKTIRYIYNRLYDYFRINSYINLPSSKFDEAIKFLGYEEEKADPNVLIIPFDKRRSCVYEVIVKNGVLYRSVISRSIGVDDRVNNGVFK